MEILRREQYREYEDFVSNHPRGEFTQSIHWPEVKNNWRFEVVVSRDEEGKIVGSCGVLIQKMPFFGTCFMYAPRGPVCDLHDRKVLEDLKAGIDALAKTYNAHTFKMDPDVPADDQEFLKTMEEMGFHRFYGPEGFETVQARFNYRLPLEGRTEEQLLAGLTQKARYNVRYAAKHGVTIRVGDKKDLDEFMRIYQVTGERDGFNTRPKAYFERMLDALGCHVRLYLGEVEGKVVSGAITTNYAGKCCYVYGASDNAYRQLMPNYLMQWEMIRWAVETGCTVYDFQGISGDLENEKGHMYGLYRFKRGFGGRVDELAGECDYHYRPLINMMVNGAIRCNEFLRTLRRKLRAPHKQGERNGDKR